MTLLLSYIKLIVKYITVKYFIFKGPLQLALPPGRGRVRAAPSPTPPDAHLNKRQSNSDEDNAFESKEEV